ncbi:cytochrome P450 [Paenibacillus shirakamiensis]|uniref:Cytochrome P450 n=1 Tax=Paenibacillus shirakamiensis TaxID=1265935 RepID=A0ABS4JEI4_9BACL|nr:cytochrome P450 [Paenibacillus shirakamiensis]MBP2000127.1 cytochrome P450 [Paenibacillus shirakamiensis]
MKTKDQLYVQEITQFKTKEQFWNPHVWYKEMREKSPVFYDEQQDTWNVFLYEDAKKVLSDYQLFPSARDRSLIPVPLEENKVNLIFSDPPEHKKRRALLAKAFTPRSLQMWEPRIKALVDELVGNLVPGEPINIVEKLAIPLPVTIIANLLGVPTEDWKIIKEWSDVLFLSHDLQRVKELKQLKEQAGKEFGAYLYPIVVAKRLDPADDIISDLIRAEYEGSHFTDMEIVHTVMGLLGAGNETTTTLITNMFYSLAEDNMAAYGQLRADPSLAPKVIEEVLRYRFNITLDRRIGEDTDIFGPHMKKDQHIIAWISSANRDESQFPNGEQFDILREGSNKHLTFGGGNHFCLGAPLARMEAVLALEAFVKRFSSYRLADDYIPQDHLGQNSHELKALSIILEE